MKEVVKVTLTFKRGKRVKKVEAQVNSANTANKLINSVRKKLPTGFAMLVRCKGLKVYSKKDVDKILRDLIRD